MRYFLRTDYGILYIAVQLNYESCEDFLKFFAELKCARNKSQESEFHSRRG
jgi:hypothetical protein